MTNEQPDGTSLNTEAPDTEFDPFAGPEIVAVAPSTEPQQEIWMAARLGNEASLAFNESATLAFTGPLDVAALHTAIADLIARHEALRATFSEDGLSMYVAAATPPVVAFEDLSALAPDGRRERLAALLAREVETPFDLVRGPLMRWQLVKLSAEEHHLIFTGHHIVCDGWSAGVIAHDLAALYSARRRGGAPALANGDSFAAYARSQHEVATAPERAADERFWVERFAGDLPVLDLPGDRARPPVKTYPSRREDHLLPADLVQRLRKSAASEKASLVAMLLAGFNALVHRLSGQDDLVVGLPAAGQSAVGLDRLVGHCVNALPLRAKVTGTQPFRALLADVRRTLLDAFEHQQYTFGTLLKKLPLRRDPSRLPLVSLMFNVDRGLGPDALKFDGLKAALWGNPRHFENFDLFLNAVDLGGEVRLECQYNTDLYDAATIRRWLGGYERLLRDAAETPAEEIGKLALVTEEERQTFAAWNQAAVAPLPDPPLVHAMIEAQVARTPDAIAVECEGQTLTYRQLDERAQELARTLRRAGVGRDKLVGLCVERSLDMFVGVLGILKAGGGYVPLDPAYPVDRLKFMVGDAAMPVLVTQRRLVAELPETAARIVCIDEREPNAAGGDPTPGNEATPESVAYVIYTSGSTGKPKGVLVPHRAVANLVASVARTPGMTGNDVVLAITTLSFDIAVSEVLLPLTVGARIVLATREVASDGERLRTLVESRKVTFIDATPASYRLLLTAGWRGSPALTLICTGEAMPRDLAIQLVDRCASLWNGYGPTETTVWSTFHKVEKPVGRILIGRPVANTRVYVLDEQRRPVPLGVRGELYIGGAGVTRGYLNRRELTEERFLPDAFSSEANARMYRTGDVVRLLPDGNLECFGRNDNQVKLRGFRIELGEIEDALGQHESVRQCAVIVREDRPGDARLVGYLALHAGATPADADLRAHLKARLPEYMVPQTFVRLAIMPLTPSGKIDRKALPAPSAEAATGSADFVAPRTPREELVAALWKEVLGVGRVSVKDDFFALGGHSLLASQILARLRREHGIELSFRKMFEAPTVEELAAVIDSQGVAAAAPSAGIPRRAQGGPAPLSIGQERLWMFEELDPQRRRVHCLPGTWRLEGPLDADRLERSLNALAKRHEPLRTSFRVEAGRPLQMVAAEVTLPLARIDLTGAQDRDRAMTEEIARVAAQPFDLSKAPLFRAALLRFGADDHVLYTLRHNLIWDGWSYDLFIRDLSELYAADEEGREPRLPALSVGYGDYAAWQREWVKGPELAKQAAFWRDRLADPPAPLALPTDKTRPPQPTFGGANERILLSSADLEALTGLARQQGSTLFMLLFAAYNVLLHRYTDERDLLIGTPVRARTQPEIEELIGLFVNAVVLRTAVEPEMTFVDLLAQVRERTLDSFGNQDLPLELLGDQAPAVRALFSLQDAKGRPADMGQTQARQFHMPLPFATNDLMLWAMEKRDGLLTVLNYSTDLFEATTARRMLASFETILRAVLADPQITVGALAILPESEQKTLLAFGGTTSPSLGHTVPELVRERLSAAPDQIVVSEGSRSLTGRELLAAAERVAGGLRALNLPADAVVAVELERSVSRLAACLGAWQAGVSVVSLDPADPDDYRARLVASARPAAILTSAAGVDGWSEPPCPVLDLAALPAPLEPAGREISRAATAALFADGDPAARVSHGALADRARALASETGLAATDVALVVMPPSLDASLIEMAAPLLAGARLRFASWEATDDAEELARLIDESEATWMLAPPATWRALLVAGFSAPRLKAISFGPLARAVSDELVGKTASLFVSWGTTEGGVVATAGVVRAGDPGGQVGKPLPGARVRVLDGRQQLAPMGVPGEIHLADEAGSERWLATGERGRWLADGRLLVDGRRVPLAQLISEGFRVEARELESVLAAHPAISEAAVRHFEALASGAKLVAYVVPRRGEEYTDTELRAAVRRRLPARLVPHLFVELERLPRTRAGDIDRQRLPAPASRVDDSDVDLQPRTEAERLVAELWQEALGIPQVTLSDNFFDLGGRSLICFQIVERIAQRAGVRLSPRTLLLNNLGQVAAQIDAGRR